VPAHGRPVDLVAGSDAGGAEPAGDPPVAANVERSMREESNDWFGVMRFHDIELIV
jgi:hypothetical protein